MLDPTHLIADLTCSTGLDDAEVIEQFMRDTILVTGLTIKHLKVMEFTNEGTDFGPGVTGIAILSESDMVVHTAPERNCLNLDLYSCRPFSTGAVMLLVDRVFGPVSVKRWDVINR